MVRFEPMKGDLEASLMKIPATVDDFIDVIMKDHRKYIKWYVQQRVRLHLSKSLETVVSTSTIKLIQYHYLILTN